MNKWNKEIESNIPYVKGTFQCHTFFRMLVSIICSLDPETLREVREARTEGGSPG